jgi:hypothetical protein
MEIVLKPSWILTNDHSASPYGQIVLVNRGTQEVYGKDDIVKPYPLWDYAPARVVVQEMMKACQLNEDELEFCGKFTG